MLIDYTNEYTISSLRSALKRRCSVWWEDLTWRWQGWQVLSRKHSSSGACHDITWSRKCGADLVFMGLEIYIYTHTYMCVCIYMYIYIYIFFFLHLFKTHFCRTNAGNGTLDQQNQLPNQSCWGPCQPVGYCGQVVLPPIENRESNPYSMELLVRMGSKYI